MYRNLCVIFSQAFAKVQIMTENLSTSDQNRCFIRGDHSEARFPLTVSFEGTSGPEPV